MNISKRESIFIILIGFTVGILFPFMNSFGLVYTAFIFTIAGLFFLYMILYGYFKSKEMFKSGKIFMLTLISSLIIGFISIESHRFYRKNVAENIIQSLEAYKKKNKYYPRSLSTEETDNYFYEYQTNSDLQSFGLYYRFQDFGLQYDSETKEWQNLGWND